MSFVEDIAKVAEKVRKHEGTVVGEPATKSALIQPFLMALGFDISDPGEVIPEFASDPAKAGPLDRVDYAIAINGRVVMLVEAKARDKKLEKHDAQLKKYFTWTQSAKVGIITNGVEYRFFTDLRAPNIMDDEPFFCFNILEYEQKSLDNLKLFHKDNFDVAIITQQAEAMIFLQGMIMVVETLLKTPPDEFIKFLIVELGKLSSKYAIKGPINKNVITKFKPVANRAIQATLVDMMTRSLNVEFAQTSGLMVAEEEDEEDEESTATEDANKEKAEENSGVVTTEEELDAFNRIKAIAATSTNPHKREVSYKDVISYFGVNVGKTTWWFLRLYLSQRKKHIVTRLSVEEAKFLCNGFEVEEVGASLGEATSRVIINSVEDIDKLAPLILRCYEMECERH